ncbi:fibroblast growth factor receptor 3-like [Acanthaster planci]|uniref:receptor protein-tyrosine kinase n=1 Tax=Acanthaster planci TaxID=133434 RepID=A0A8B7ZWE2_ACAPL|nr:fibroblast growth factor receptor 3-like [Acanthaster planci]
MDFIRGLSLCTFVWIVLIYKAAVAVFTGPQDTSVLRGATTTLYCRNPDYTGPGVTFWSEGGDTFATEGGVFGSNTKYDNFDVITSSSTPTTQLDLQITNAQITDEGTYECEITPSRQAATLKVEIAGTVDGITIDGDSSGNPVILRATVESVLRCTARGFRPAVNLEWYKNNVQITTGVSEDAPTVNGDGTNDTSGTLTFTPTRQDNEAILECRTTGQVVAPAQKASLTLNVQYVPVVSVGYANEVITCSSDANPLATSKIILNGTQVVKEFTTSQGSHPFTTVDGCTVISCNATNTVGTGTAIFPEEICPGPPSTTKTSIQTTLPPVEATTGLPNSVGAVVGATVAAFVAGIAAASAIFYLLRRRQNQPTETRGSEKNSTREGSDYLNPDEPFQSASEVAKRSQDILMTNTSPAVVYESIQEDPNVSQASKATVYGNVGPDLAFPRDLVIIEKELGRGAFGKVLLGSAVGIEENGKRTMVAVKTLKGGASNEDKKELLEELDLMRKVGPHPNVVQLLGYCKEKDPVYVIVEYLAKGDLKKVLLSYRDKDRGTGYSNVPGLSKTLSRTLVKFARDVASGMAFLSSQKCVHRDLAARNVLVSDDLVCKVSDFGLARDVMNIRIYQRQSQGPLPMRWMALESLLDDVYTTESDVWSFGVLLWEIITLGARPYPMMTAQAAVRQLQKGYRMPKPQHCSNELYAMMCSCWQKIPQDRPTFQSLYQQLNNMLSEDKDYITFHKLDESIYEVTMIEASNEKV